MAAIHQSSPSALSRAIAYRTKIPSPFAVQREREQRFDFFHVIEDEHCNGSRIVPWQPMTPTETPKETTKQNWTLAKSSPLSLRTAPNTLCVETINGKEFFQWALNGVFTQTTHEDEELEVPVLSFVNKRWQPRFTHGFELALSEVVPTDSSKAVADLLSSQAGADAWNAYKNSSERFIVDANPQPKELEEAGSDEGASDTDSEDGAPNEDYAADLYAACLTSVFVFTISFFISFTAAHAYFRSEPSWHWTAPQFTLNNHQGEL